MVLDPEGFGYPKTSTQEIAVLVDGENVSQAFAGQIVRQAGALGRISIWRVFGNAKLLPKWDDAARFRLIHTKSGKNATDIALIIDAMALAGSGRFGTIVLVASDGDYEQLATRLREDGLTVVGLGEEGKAPLAFIKACDSYTFLEKSVPVIPKKEPKIVKNDRMDEALSQSINHLKDQDGWAKIGELGSMMWAKHNFKRAETKRASWGKYLAERDEFCVVDNSKSPKRTRLILNQQPHTAP